MSLAPLILGVILGVIVVILGFFLLVQNYHQRISRNFSVATIAIGIAVISSNLAVYAPIFTPQIWLQVAILFYMLTHVFHILFTYDFPQRDSMSKYGPIHSFFYILMCVPLVYFLIADVDKWFTLQLVSDIGRYYIRSEWMINMWGGFVLINLLIAYIPMYRRLKILRGYEREQIRLMLLGLLGLVFIWCGVGFIVPLFIDTNLSLLTLGTYAIVFYPVFTIYIIMRHRLFDVRLAQWRLLANLGYYIVSVFITVASLYYLFPVIFPVTKIVWQLSFWEVLISCMGFVLVFSALAIPVRNIYLRVINGLIYGQRGDVQKIVHEFTNTIGHSVDLNTIRSTTISTFVTLFNLDSITMYLESIPHDLAQYLQSETRLISYDALVNEATVDRSEDRLEDPESNELVRYMRSNNFEIILPLLQKDSLIGVIVMGAKKDGSVFTDAELSLMESMGKQMSISLENAYLFEVLKEERNQVEAERNKLDLVLKSTVDGVIALDKDCRISFINDAACNFIGWEKHLLLHRNIEQVLHLAKEQHQEEDLSKELCTIDQKEVSFYNVRLTSKSGDVKYVNVVSNLVSEKILGINRIITLHDVTRENELEQIRIDFVSLAAHELKTPLTILRGYLYYLVGGVDAAAITPKAAESLNRAIVSTKTLTNLVDNLLNVSRIEQGKMQVSPQPTNILDIIEKTMLELMPLADDAGLKLELIPPEKELPLVMADATRIGEVMRNLISNAIKYTQTGTITISCRLEQEELIVSVKDTGQGIAKKSMPRLFTKFFREEQEMSKGSKGTGLGLYISKSILTAHGGRIWVESEVGKGSTFFFTLKVVNKG